MNFKSPEWWVQKSMLVALPGLVLMFVGIKFNFSTVRLIGLGLIAPLFFILVLHYVAIFGGAAFNYLNTKKSSKK